MSYNDETTFNKENLDLYLKALGKEFRRLNGKATPADIILIGGAAVLANYGFRDMTADIDAIVRASSAMKDAIRSVGDRYNLPNGWLNSDFEHTASYTPKLLQYARYYRTFSNVLTVRTISAEYLIAMKLRSGRQYKNDLSDVLGILNEHAQREAPITLEQIKVAVLNLYGAWEALPEHSIRLIESACASGRYGDLYVATRQGEQAALETLVQFEQNNPGQLNEERIDAVLDDATDPPRESVREVLRRLRAERETANPTTDEPNHQQRER